MDIIVGDADYEKVEEASDESIETLRDVNTTHSNRRSRISPEDKLNINRREFFKSPVIGSTKRSNMEP